ncbi:MAG: hypothetical protein MJ240_09115, partial [Kiritimatiellae bacterium]|nr:hypothetical protein [Kiritimatiellia bacterium]
MSNTPESAVQPATYILPDGFTVQDLAAPDYVRPLAEAAARRNGATEVDAVVVNASRADALRAALKANAVHGLRRTNADKRHAMEMVWESRAALFPADLKECHYATTLGELCGVTRPTATAFLNSGFCK